MAVFFHSIDLDPGKALLAFALPIVRLDLNAGSLNGLLAQLALTLERTETAGLKRSNVGSWRSQGNIFCSDARHEPVELLREKLTAAIRHLVLTELQISESCVSRLSVKLDGWINVLRRGAYHTTHMHPGATWAGVYYVTAGTSGADDGGVIEFINTGNTVLPYQVNGKTIERNRKIRIDPRPGLLLLFPGSLWHTVLPYYGSSPRITVAFNVSDVCLEHSCAEVFGPSELVDPAEV